jgi:2-polyprenyl-3-methyl-5-hydroxy-6-metoxy-1,4-benzoquinol methylase
MDRRGNSEFDQEKAEALAARLLSTLNSAALCLMISVAHRTGLFDAMSRLTPSTVKEIAAASGLNERYVREWLGAVVTGGVVEMDPSTGKFFLPPEHAAFLTRSAGPNNIAVPAQYIPELAAVEDDIVECFRRGGGVPYFRYPRFHEVMAEDSGQSVLSSIDTHILPLIPGFNGLLQAGIRVLDAGCGRGLIIMRLAELYPNSRFLGIDFSEEAISFAQTEAARRGLNNVEFLARDLSDFDSTAEAESFDFITTFDAIHDQAKPLNVLRGIHRALKRDGVYLMQDISGTGDLHEDIAHPLGTLLYTVSCMHCMTVSLAQRGEGLGAMWGEKTTREYLRKAGFRSIETHRLEHDFMNNWYVVTK